MRTTASDKDTHSDKWLSALVDEMDEVESLRADDYCREASVPAGLIAQLYGRTPRISVPRQWAPFPLELA